MLKKTKIVATIGPATSNEKQIANLILAGVNVFRFNLKHNSEEWHQSYIELVRKVALRHQANISVLADLQGPSLRTDYLEDDQSIIKLKKGETVFLAAKKFDLKYKWIPFTQIKTVKDLSKGSAIHIADGLIELSCIEFSKNKFIKAKVINGYDLGNRKSVNMPDAKLDLPVLTDKDKSDIKLAAKTNSDFIALSFVRDRKDVLELKKEMQKHDCRSKIISKIETKLAIDNFDDILDESDGIMVARGDLGVEIPMERVPKIQKHIISKCRISAKPVIVATQMLKSMIENPLPTRAEVADIANTVLEKTDAIMLSEETAIGNFAEKAVSTMSKIARYNESQDQMIDEEFSDNPKTFQEVIINASLKFSKTHAIKNDKIAGYLVFTKSGRSARYLARYRSYLPVYAFTTNDRVAKSLNLSYGVESFVLGLQKNPVVNIKHATHILKHYKIINRGERLIVIFGSDVGVLEANNSLSIITA